MDGDSQDGESENGLLAGPQLEESGERIAPEEEDDDRQPVERRDQQRPAPGPIELHTTLFGGLGGPPQAGDVLEQEGLHGLGSEHAAF